MLTIYLPPLGDCIAQRWRSCFSPSRPGFNSCIWLLVKIKPKNLALRTCCSNICLVSAHSEKELKKPLGANSIFRDPKFFHFLWNVLPFSGSTLSHTWHLVQVVLNVSHSFMRAQTSARLKQAWRRLNPTRKQSVSFMGDACLGYHVKYLSCWIKNNLGIFQNCILSYAII